MHPNDTIDPSEPSNDGPEANEVADALVNLYEDHYREVVDRMVAETDLSRAEVFQFITANSTIQLEKVANQFLALISAFSQQRNGPDLTVQ